MSSTRAHPEAASTDALAAELRAAIGQLPRRLRAPIYMPTERVPLPEAIAGLARVNRLYAGDLDAIYRPRLRDLKRARQGRRCFIIGNGPSLARTDLSRLRGEATFATNGFFLKMGELDWTPTYYVVEDHLVGEDRADDLIALSGTTKLFPATLAYALPPDEDTIYFDHRPRKSYPNGFDFSFDADLITYGGGTVTFTCMQLAAYLGFREIYLIGVDADYAIPKDAAVSGPGAVKVIDMASDDPNHFDPNYFGKGKRWHEPNVEVMLGAYVEARRATEARGVSIVNATVGGKLEVFPRIDYGALFRPTPAERLLVLDHTQMGNATATGEVKAALFADWPEERLAQVYEDGNRSLRLAGGPAEIRAAGSLTHQIEAFAPDVVLYRPVPRTPALHDFAMGLLAGSDLALAVWIVDDWPAALARSEPAAAARMDADFRWLLARAEARFSISPAMSAAFHERYGHPFLPIANGIDPADWPPAQRRDPAGIKVRYAGGLARNMTLATVEMVARAVEELAANGLDISLEIRTHGHWLTNADDIGALHHTSIATSELGMHDYRRWLAEADILLVAYNFDPESRDYIRYSLANKLPECLASGAAVLAVGPDDVGTIATLADLDLGERVTVADPALIGGALRRLAASPDRRFELASSAQVVAFSEFDMARTRQAFEATVHRVAAEHRKGEYRREVHAHVDETAVVAGLLHDRRGAAHVMLDVGAHTGSSAARFDQLGWSVYCFEPHPAARQDLAMRFRKYGNVHIDARALGEHAAAGVALYDSPESTGIATLEPSHPSHRLAGQTDVTTIAEVVAGRGLARVDFLKIDVEGLEFAVLKGVPWSQLRPEVIECEFEDAKTLPHGHAWRDIATYLAGQGYAVYVSEWHPVVRYAVRHDWRRVAPLGADLDVHPAAWGRLLAFANDPGWPTIRAAFSPHIERGAVPAVLSKAQASSQAARKEANWGPARALRRIARLGKRAGRGVWRRVH